MGEEIRPAMNRKTSDHPLPPPSQYPPAPLPPQQRYLPQHHFNQVPGKDEVGREWRRTCSPPTLRQPCAHCHAVCEKPHSAGNNRNKYMLGASCGPRTVCQGRNVPVQAWSRLVSLSSEKRFWVLRGQKHGNCIWQRRLCELNESLLKHIYTYTYTNTHIHTFTHIYTCTYTHTHIYTHTYTHTRTYIHTHMHTHIYI